MKKVKLFSGAELGLAAAPFADAKALYQALLVEVKGTKYEKSEQVDNNFIKDILCGILSSKQVDEALAKCLARCTYNGSKIDSTTFENEEARVDYLQVCQEVTKENVQPFTKGLSALLSQGLEILGSFQ